MRSPGRFHVTLSFEGWEHYQDLKRGATDSRKAFMAMQYGNEQLNKVVEEVFKPAVKQTGFDLVRLDEKPKAGLIDDRLRVEIQTSRFLIADLTDENAGAYWEAGYAEGLGKPVIYTCEKGKFEESKSHFDTNHHLTITWDATSAEEAAEELKATIRATLAGEAKLTDE
jgi:nucleoside 2-deoxyribosyltransferase